MKCLVLGATGMAGHIMVDKLLFEGYEVVGTSRYPETYSTRSYRLTAFNATQMDSWTSFFNEFVDFDVVINCIGVLVQASEQNSYTALVVNSLLPKFLESYFRHTNTQVIHISTDCVFSGTAGPYTDIDTPSESGVYGHTKQMGELVNSKDLTIRTSIIGPELGNKVNSDQNSGLIDWFLKNPRGSSITGYSRCFWSGISTLELADAVFWYLRKKQSGLHQISRTRSISKYELLCIANDVFERNIAIEACGKKVLDKSLVPSLDAYPIRDSYEDMLRRIKSRINFYSKDGYECYKI